MQAREGQYAAVPGGGDLPASTPDILHWLVEGQDHDGLADASSGGAIGSTSLRQNRIRWLTALLGVALLVVGVARVAGGARARHASASFLKHEVQGLSELQGPTSLCERCPVGQCDRGPTGQGPCVWFLPPADNGAYHCRVADCGEVPGTIQGTSTCWQYDGKSFYSIFSRDSPCSDQAAPASTTLSSTVTSSTTLPTTRTPTSTTRTTTTATKERDAELSIFDAQAREVVRETRVQDPRLSAYWDQGTCGPMGEKGDDHNSEWCGGLVYTPNCRRQVTVDASICISTKANLNFVSGGVNHDGDARFWMSGCNFMYFAQYECEASTTTTSTDTSTTFTSTATSTTRTTSTTTTTTETSTITSTSTSTASSTTTTTLTTTQPTGACLQPLLGPHFDVSNCSNVRPPNGKCIVTCGNGWEGGSTTFFCKYQDDRRLHDTRGHGGDRGHEDVRGHDDNRRHHDVRRDLDRREADELRPHSFVGSPPDCFSSTTSTTTTTTTTTQTQLTTSFKMEKKILESQSELEFRIGRWGQWAAEAGFPEDCEEGFNSGPAPAQATDYNGKTLPNVCYKKKGPHKVFVIGDWGGVLGPHGPVPADQRAPEMFLHGVDDRAQQRVAAQMQKRAEQHAPDYILNAGDNFYWAGLDTKCGLVPGYAITPTGQFQWVFEAVYKGKGIDNVPWLGVLGNHDYGGYMFNKGWDQVIAYTWGPGGRWVMPAQYWRSKVYYPGFSVEYWFLDTNKFNAHAPDADPEHNICSKEHLFMDGSGCGDMGPKDVWDCPGWFQKLWDEQSAWLESGLDETTSTWQVIVTHFPPTWHTDYWMKLTKTYGVDMLVTGHMHHQELHYDDPGNYLYPTAWMISGGGGGITSEGKPNRDGIDDQYGFYELTLTRDYIEIVGISHGGLVRSSAFVKPRPRGIENGHPHSKVDAEHGHEVAPGPAHAGHDTDRMDEREDNSHAMRFKK